MTADEIKENKYRVKREIEAVESEISAWEARKQELYGELRYWQSRIADEDRRPVKTASASTGVVNYE